MNIRHLRSFVRALPPPLGLDPSDFPLGKIRALDISVHITRLEGVQAYDHPETGVPEVIFRQMLDALSNLVYADVHEEISQAQGTDDESKVMRQLRLAREHELEALNAMQNPKNNLVELHSACVIQVSHRGGSAGGWLCWRMALRAGGSAGGWLCWRMALRADGSAGGWLCGTVVLWGGVGVAPLNASSLEMLGRVVRREEGKKGRVGW